MNKKIITALLICMFIPALVHGALSKQEKAERDARAEEKASAITASIIKPEMTEFEKILILHEYITDRVTYGKLNGETNSYTALLHDQADCVGFARGLDTLLKAAGLDSFAVVRKKGHLWVKVKVRGTYYNIDPTWSAVKSRWPQYNWFLLSDAQNVDANKGVDHILDSGESYPPAPDEFIFKESDYIHTSLLRSETKLRIIGKVSLPAGDTAAKGGISGDVNGIRFVIPEGRSSAFFITSIPRDSKKDPVIKVRVSTDASAKYAPEIYYAAKASARAVYDAYRFDLKGDDATKADITLPPMLSAAENRRPVRPVFTFTDRMAADSKAAAYRAMDMDAAVTAVPADIESKIFSEPGEKTVAAFAQALTSNTADPFIKAKRIHDWITWNIAYDSDLLIRLKKDKNPDGSNEPMGVLKYKRTNCEGFARLYETIAKAAGLDVRYLTGFIKKSENSAGNLTSHAWNQVRINGSWYIVDCSADSRFFYTNKKLGKKMDYSARCDNLFVHPEAKRLAYLAEDPQHQLAQPPLGSGDFRKLPRAEITMFKYGMAFAGETLRNVKTFREEKNGGGADLFDEYTAGTQPFEMTFSVPADVHIQASMKDSFGKNMDHFIHTERNGGMFICRFSAPSAGIYQCAILARSLALAEKVNSVYAFRLSAPSAMKLLTQAVQKIYVAELYGADITVIRRLKNTDTIFIETVHPADIKIVSVVKDMQDKTTGITVKAIPTPKGTTFEYRLPDKTPYIIAVSGSPLNDTSGKGHQRLFTVNTDRIP